MVREVDPQVRRCKPTVIVKRHQVAKSPCNCHSDRLGSRTITTAGHKDPPYTCPNDRSPAMTRRLLLLLSLAFAPALAFATPPAQPCRTTITSPADGATGVKLDAAVTGTSVCSGQAPQFVDDTGATVPADFVITGGNFSLKPLAPLAPNRTYTVTFGNHSTCDTPTGKSTFTTAAKPAIRHLNFIGAVGELHAVDVDLTEPVLQPTDLAEGSTLVSATVDGFALVPKIQTGQIAGKSFHIYFKNLPERPKATQKLHVRLHKGLRFASGVVLAEDLELTVVPANLPYGWYATGLPQPCPFVAKPPIGCQSSPNSGGGLAGILLAGAVLLLLASRRRKVPT